MCACVRVSSNNRTAADEGACKRRECAEAPEAEAEGTESGNLGLPRPTAQRGHSRESHACLAVASSPSHSLEPACLGHTS